MRAILMLGRLILIVLFVYIMAWLLNWLPANVSPETLFDKEYKSFKEFVAKDAESKSMTAGISKYISDHINSMPDSSTQQQADNSSNPMNKASSAIKAYEDQEQKEKTEIDNINSN